MNRQSSDPSTHAPAIAHRDVPELRGSTYPEPLAAVSKDRIKRRLGDAFGLTQFGVNHVVLEPGVQSALRHWHLNEDEFVYVLRGHPTLITSQAEQALSPGMCVGFRGGVADGHHIVNNSDAAVELLEVGTRLSRDPCFYPDDDLMWVEEPDARVPLHKDGTRY